MENKGYIEIRVMGKKGELPVSPKTYDISEIRTTLDQAEKLLFPHDRKSRPSINYEISEGSVRHRFWTTLQVIIGFNAVLGQIKEKGTLEFLEYPTAQAISALQDSARNQNYSFDIATSIDRTNHVVIDPTTDYAMPQEQWVEAEFYFYGDVTNMGGKQQPNIHVSAPGLGVHIIRTPKEVLVAYENNPLYKPLGVRATGRQNLATGELDSHSLKFKEFVEYSPDYDEKYLNSLIEKAGETWADVKDPDEWIRELRGGIH